jgi:flagellar hook protein FlgE
MSLYQFQGADWTDPDLAANWAVAETANSNGLLEFAPTFIGGSSMDIEFNIGSTYDGASWVNDSLATTQYARSSTTTFQSANGYGAGDLQSVTVDVDGSITGTYSNGQLLPLFRVALAKFQNVHGLYKEGGNLFKQTMESGDAITNRPGTNGLGSIAPSSLEQSNVDIANEFVKMITTQRGFQANSKIITVTDQMLADLINLKR